MGMRGEVCTESLPCRPLSYLHNHPLTLQDWIASLSRFTGEKTGFERLGYLPRILQPLIGRAGTQVLAWRE